jgi:hypothetical protein
VSWGDMGGVVALPPLPSQVVCRDGSWLCWRLGFSGRKLGLALLPASKHVSLKGCLSSPGRGHPCLTSAVLSGFTQPQSEGPSDRDPA